MRSNNKHPDAFSDCHPAVTFLYFAVVLLVSMFLTHPVLLGVSFAGALAYAIVLKGARSVVKLTLVMAVPLMIVVMIINPAFNHYGTTYLFYLSTGPVTLEAMVYGIVLASMLLVAILWFSCINAVMTTDKFVYLFGRIIPAMSLVLSMVFRFVPRFSSQLKVIRNGQKAVGRDIGNGRLTEKIRHAIGIISILVTWALENAIETSDSMRSRGYGLKGRSSFSIFHFDRRAAALSVVLGVLLALCMVGFLNGMASASYNPVIQIAGLPLSWASSATYAAWATICFAPTIFSIYDSIRWRRLQRRASAKRQLPWYLAPEKSGN